MKTTTLTMILALSAGLAAAGTAQAAGKIYIGGKVGVVDADSGVSGVGFDPAVTVGVYGGFNILGKDSQFAANLNDGTLAVEGEAMLTVLKGDAGLAGDWDVTSIGAFAAYRHPLTNYFYLKGKAGVVHYTIDTDFIPAAGDTTNTLAVGVGAGWKVGPGSIEADLTAYGSDVRMLSAGFHMNF